MQDGTTGVPPVAALAQNFVAGSNPSLDESTHCTESEVRRLLRSLGSELLRLYRRGVHDPPARSQAAPHVSLKERARKQPDCIATFALRGLDMSLEELVKGIPAPWHTLEIERRELVSLGA